ncbi:unnamed protein product [Darwinula stevensoni]|uniref:Ig-like domain-containing protein n=1 Tax=Darwinula stevensoni TaxID=69355 RepID=A0A7R9A1X7_9CRUS|nr:unnamed protein product [Darwinula stevensoni]CAG0884521.1 unnamed protein product [Darwinula stevensoni]
MLLWISVLVPFIGICVGKLSTSQEKKDGPVWRDTMVAIKGDMVRLPCDLTTPQPDDRVQLVLWYREDTGSPIYSFDVRGRNFDDAKPWADDVFLGGRASLDPTDAFPLAIRAIRSKDEGIYRCRVDFKMSPTRNSLVNLTVIVPPKTPKIFDKSGLEVENVLGPYSEGDNLTLTCKSTEGRPPPRLTWWHENALLDATYTTTPDGEVRNVLEIPNLKRENLRSSFSCQAANNNVTVPVSNTVSLDMNFRPYEVRILGSRQPLSAGKMYEIACRSLGSRPPARITWWRGAEQLASARETHSADGNITASTLEFTASVQDINKHLVCRAENPEIPDSTIEDHWELEIYYVPRAKLSLGKSLNPKAIKEGDDVYFECHVSASPAVYKISWQHDGKPLSHNVSEGIILSNQSLVLQRVKKAQAGRYTCLASNLEGVGTSNAVILNVRFSPICATGQKLVYGAGRREEIEIRCSVESIPGATAYRWSFNNSQEIVDIAQSLFTKSPEESILRYTPMTEKDYGTVLCWALNLIGNQAVPCAFHVVPAGAPDPPINCSITNHTSTSMDVDCVEGFDGGLVQSFALEVYDATSPHTLLTNLTRNSPSFSLEDLVPGSHVILSLYSTNAKGRSGNVVLQGHTLRLPERILDSNTAQPSSSIGPFRITPILGVLIGVVAALVMAALIIVVVMRFRDAKPRKQKHKSSGGSVGDQGCPSASIPLKTDVEEDCYGVDKYSDLPLQPQELDYPDVCSDKEHLKLNNVIPYYEHERDPSSNSSYQSKFNTLPKQNGDVTYAELDISGTSSRRGIGGGGHGPTVYATIDHGCHGHGRPRTRALGVSTSPSPPAPQHTQLTPLMRSNRESSRPHASNRFSLTQAASLHSLFLYTEFLSAPCVSNIPAGVPDRHRAEGLSDVLYSTSERGEAGRSEGFLGFRSEQECNLQLRLPVLDQATVASKRESGWEVRVADVSAGNLALVFPDLPGR